MLAVRTFERLISHGLVADVILAEADSKPCAIIHLYPDGVHESQVGSCVAESIAGPDGQPLPLVLLDQTNAVLGQTRPLLVLDHPSVRSICALWTGQLGYEHLPTLTYEEFVFLSSEPNFEVVEYSNLQQNAAVNPYCTYLILTIRLDSGDIFQLHAKGTDAIQIFSHVSKMGNK